MNGFLRPIIIGLVVLVLIFSLHYIGWLKPAENFVVWSVSPVQRFFYGFSLNIKSFYNSWLSKKDLVGLNRDLIEKLKDQQIDQSKIRSLEEENLLLKKELSFVEKNKLNYVTAKIVTGVSNPNSISVIIDRGQIDGLAKGMAVIAEGGILVGKITEVYDNFSKVLLLSDNRSRVAATILNANQTVGLVEGQFGLSFSMTDIPQDQEIKESDMVITSGLEGQIPRGLLIAEVESVNQVESEIFKTAILRPIISFDNLSYVLVIKP